MLHSASHCATRAADPGFSLLAERQVAKGRQNVAARCERETDICPNESRFIEVIEKLERVKGNEPSYSAWKGFGG
jgi:hypothetical protein